MARLDHIAYRVADRNKTAKFFIEAFGYRRQTEFDIKFPDGTCCACIALEPPEKIDTGPPLPPEMQTPASSQIWKCTQTIVVGGSVCNSDGSTPKGHGYHDVEFHMAPEIFISSSEDPESIVSKWVINRGGVGGIHHIAYQVDSVEETMKEWQKKGYAEFSSDKPLTCPGLTQVFTKPSELTGVIYEFIERGEHGFCAENVQALMESTKNNK